jgi:hypothetical protein
MFFDQTVEWGLLGHEIIERACNEWREQGLDASHFSLILTTKGADGPEGFVHNADWRGYPCSLVKVFHLVHALTAIDRGSLSPEPELDRALRDMILWSSNTATNYVIDLLTGTTGDTLLQGAEYLDWTIKRQKLNRFFDVYKWDEWEGCNITQKLMDDTRYGREAQFAGVDGSNLNVLTATAAARLMWELFDGTLPLLPDTTAYAQQLLSRNFEYPDAANPNYQIKEYLAAELPKSVSLWSKAGHNLWTGDARSSWYKHDMLRVTCPSRRPLNVVFMSKGAALADQFPNTVSKLGKLIWDMTEDILRL